MLDSNFEIALKEFVVHRTDLFPARTTDISQLFGRRSKVIAAVQPHVTVDAKLWAKAEHYYGLRNKLIHERATVEITDTDIANYRDTVEQILAALFDLDF